MKLIKTIPAGVSKQNQPFAFSPLRLGWAFLACLCLGLAGCASDRIQKETLQVTTSSDAANNWLRVQVDPSLAPDVVWQKIVDSVTEDYSSLEMVDMASGYIRSVYTIRRIGEPGSSNDTQIRTRFVCSIASKSPLVYKIKIESEILTPGQDWMPYERVLKPDEQLVEELQSRLGVK